MARKKTNTSMKHMPSKKMKKRLAKKWAKRYLEGNVRFQVCDGQALLPACVCRQLYILTSDCQDEADDFFSMLFDVSTTSSVDELYESSCNRTAEIEAIRRVAVANGPRFLNDDYLVTTCRTASKISETELREMIIAEANRRCPVQRWDSDDHSYRPWTKKEIEDSPDEYIQDCISTFFTEPDDESVMECLASQYFGIDVFDDEEDNFDEDDGFDEDEDEDEDIFDDSEDDEDDERCYCSLGEFELRVPLCCPNAYIHDSDLEKVMGFHTLPNGLTFCGFELQEENDPFVVIIYFDGEKLQLYIPRWGNCIEPTEMSIWFWGGDIWGQCEHYAKYGFSDTDKNVLNQDAMLNDISIAIQVTN